TAGAAGYLRRLGRGLSACPFFLQYTGKPVKSQVAGALQLGEINNLSGMVGEMRDHIRHGGNPRDAKALNRVFARQSRGRKPLERAAGFPNGLAEPRNQDSPPNGAALGELAVTHPDVGNAAQAGNDPLPDIAAEMQRQISRAVRGGVGAPPDFLDGEQLQAIGDMGKIPAERLAGYGEKQLRDHLRPRWSRARSRERDSRSISTISKAMFSERASRMMTLAGKLLRPVLMRRVAGVPRGMRSLEEQRPPPSESSRIPASCSPSDVVRVALISRARR